MMSFSSLHKDNYLPSFSNILTLLAIFFGVASLFIIASPAQAQTSDPHAEFTITDRFPSVDESVYYDGSGMNDPDGCIQHIKFSYPDTGGYASLGWGCNYKWSWMTIGKSWGTPGVKTVKFTVTDEEGGTDSQSKWVCVGSVNCPPLGINDYYTAANSSVLSVSAPGVLSNDTDKENDSLVVDEKVTDANNGTVNIDPDGSFEFDPDDNFAGTSTFTYEVSDGQHTSEGKVYIDVTDKGAAADITAASTSVSYNGSTTLSWSYDNVVSGTTTSSTGNSQWANANAIQPGSCSTENGKTVCSGSATTTITNLTSDAVFNLDYDGTYEDTASDSVTVDVAGKPVDLDVDLDAVDLGGDTSLQWSTTGMDTCEASSDPTDENWTTDTNPEPDGGTQALQDIRETTDYTLTCEDGNGNTVSDTVTVTVRGFELQIDSRDIWGIQLDDSLTTQTRIRVEPGDAFTGNVSLSADPDTEESVPVDFRFLDADGNPLGSSVILEPFQFDDGVWLQAQVTDAANVPVGRTPVSVNASSVVGTSSANQTIDMHIRSIIEE